MPVNLVGGAGAINLPSWAPDGSHPAFVSYRMLPEGETGASE
jgi:Tol biopolymer transport system component